MNSVQDPKVRMHVSKGIILLILFSVLLLYGAAVEASPESNFHKAERCSAQLRNSPAKQKYRDQWQRCIEGYLAVSNEDPKGPWAAVGLFKAGELYMQMYKVSFIAADKQQALDLFDRVIQSFPKSRYRPKAEAARNALGGSSDKPSISSSNTSASPSSVRFNSKAREAYKQARAQVRRLEREPRLRKYRDQWFKAIDHFRKVLKEDDKGPLAPAALFGMAQCYTELSALSFLEVDQIQAENTYREVIRLFPDSAYAEKARSALGDKVQPAKTADHSDSIAQIIHKATPEPAVSVQDVAANLEGQTPAVIESLRYWSNPRYTRVVVDVNQDTSFSYHELREDPSAGKPQRIYIEVHNSRLSRNLQKVVSINDNLLSDARAGQYTPDTVRVVVDIKSFKHYKIFSLKNPFRIVLDVWGVEKLPDVAAPKMPVPDKNQKLPTSAIVKQLALGVKRIVIDPGHGGKDYGAPGYKKGVHEKHVVLEIAKRLSGMMRNELGCDVVLTRDRDVYLSLEERTAIANTQNADLFISIHTNASTNRNAFGLETFILNLATDDEAILVAARENATSTKNISDLDSILQDLMQNAKVSESSRLASYVQHSMLGHLEPRYSQIRNKGVKQAPFYVLLGAEMPSILVETAFISNPRECERLTSKEYQELICKGIIAGVKRYMNESRPMVVPTIGSDKKRDGRDG